VTRSEELIEQLAAIEHERWADWQRWMHEQCYPITCADNIPRMAIPQDLWERWERQIATPYAELSEREKQSDRDQVARYWPLIEPLLKEDPTP
jgi:tRNA A37 threonylcarbamoyladenosine synthetase subunit TsaC/SUA5/YrdC